ncbi:hypothetical protein ABEY41_26750 [Peribacillus butanolivorans]|uniref:hypothetical protein n=1 Tax=Peribacillus butanolivorans TaxID=421767 RepID=UPI003D2CBD60
MDDLNIAQTAVDSGLAIVNRVIIIGEDDSQLYFVIDKANLALIPEIYSEVLDEAILDESFNSFIFFYCYNSYFFSSADEYLLSEHL